MDATTLFVVVSSLIPGLAAFAIALLAIYWVVRKAIHDELGKFEQQHGRPQCNRPADTHRNETTDASNKTGLA